MKTGFSSNLDMSITSFDELHNRFKNSMLRLDTKMRNCIQPVEMLAVTIRYLASGHTFTDMSFEYRLGISTISIIVKEVCQAMWSIMKSECMPIPGKEMWELIALKFEQRANFPHCLGAVNGKHIRIINPLGSMYHNYKGYASVVLMAVADSESSSSSSSSSSSTAYHSPLLDIGLSKCTPLRSILGYSHPAPASHLFGFGVLLYIF
ncbi:hypothetical protein evm_004142 [Chilo suppressalis]|nr:hypothetical protein evm_004142 [Chilo suppressalis]